MVNKQGQTRLASYYEWFPIQERVALEAEVGFAKNTYLYIRHVTNLFLYLDYSPLLVSNRISMFIYRVPWI
jgi:hypothetical protein